MCKIFKDTANAVNEWNVYRISVLEKENIKLERDNEYLKKSVRDLTKNNYTPKSNINPVVINTIILIGIFISILVIGSKII